MSRTLQADRSRFLSLTDSGHWTTVHEELVLGCPFRTKLYIWHCFVSLCLTDRHLKLLGSNLRQLSSHSCASPVLTSLLLYDVAAFVLGAERDADIYVCQ